MSPRFEFHVLGSGSRGNATVVSFSDHTGRLRHILLDMGLGPRVSHNRAAEVGIDLDLIEAVILTHGDSDHCSRNWANTIERRGIPVYAAPSHIQEVVSRGFAPSMIRQLQSKNQIANCLHIHTTKAPHDRTGSCTLRIEHVLDEDVCALGWATDLGRFIPSVEELLRGCHALAIESNYDHRMQLESDRPDFLKQRIMGGNGHLSNHEAHSAALALTQHHPLSAVVLLHLSRDCNDPEIITRHWEENTPELASRMQISLQHAPLGPIQVRSTAPHDAQEFPQTLWT